MDKDTIHEMFIEMGLGSVEQREKLVRELSINKVDNSCSPNVEIIISTNTLNVKQYAKLARYPK